MASDHQEQLKLSKTKISDKQPSFKDFHSEWDHNFMHQALHQSHQTQAEV